MNASAGKSTEASTSWLASLFPCCAPRPRAQDHCMASSTTSLETVVVSQELTVTDEKEKFPPLVYDQPFPQAQLVVTCEAASPPPSRRSKTRPGTAGSGRFSFSTMRPFKSDASSRRPLISAPSEFRHVNTGAFQFPPLDSEPSPPPVPVLRTRSEPYRASFRPLELSIYVDDSDNLSPILPHFEFLNEIPGAPPPAYMPRRSNEDHQLFHQRSNTSLPFHLPRRQFVEGRVSEEAMPPPLKVTPVRGRAYTSPEVDTLKERVASAMIEMEKLQKQIDDVIERQSVYAMSRPSTPKTIAAASGEYSSNVAYISSSSVLIPFLPLEAPLPSIPALPPAAPSFAQRLHSDMDAPSVARLEAAFPPSSPAPTGNKSTTSLDKYPLPPSPQGSPIPPPPLPLVLRPPLRKKKSFSRVSKWLSDDSRSHSRDISLDSITNLPRPIKDRDGFYQSVTPGGSNASIRESQDTTNSAISWDTDGQRTALTAWSPDSTPLSKEMTSSPIERHGTFGKGTRAHVGVAV